MNRRQRQQRRKRAQRAADQSKFGIAASEDLYLEAKKIDGYPDSEWSFPVFVHRADKGNSRVTWYFYEDLTDFTTLLALVHMNATLESAGADTTTRMTFTIGMNMFESGLYSADGVLERRANDRWLGRHNVAVVGVAQDQLVFRNSWGAAWGDGGYGYVTREYFSKWVDSAMVARRADIGPTSTS